MPSPFDYSRRTLLKTLSTAAVWPPALGLMCADGASAKTNERNSSISKSGVQLGGYKPWAAGDTNLIKTQFPDTSLFDSADACSIGVTRQSTAGPCYYSVAEREDISAGIAGLPMQLCLQITDIKCNPLAGALVEVWHCDPDGIYSGGDQSNSVRSDHFRAKFCSRGNSNALSSTWFRGGQTTDKEGRVNFKSCFPGWYPGRSIHVHFRVRAEGAASSVSQLGFDEHLSDDITSSHPHYANRGHQDTPLSADFVFNKGNDDLLMKTQQNPDGSLLAYKIIKVR